MIAARPAEPQQSATEVALSPTRTLVLPEPGLVPGEGMPDPLALRHSLPDFLVARWRAHHGAAVQGICAAASARPEVFLRNCAPQCDVPALQQRLSSAGVECAAASHPRVLRWSGGESPFATACFRDGWFVVQDPTAVRAAEAVPVRLGGSVLDLCAAPGTKATLLAEGVGAGGAVYAFDRDVARRQRIRDNAARLRLPQLQMVEDLDAVPPVDAVLVDVPCSNTGVIARRVEVRRRLRPVTIVDLAAAQRELLLQATQRVAPGGTVVYSTCSLEPEENGQLVREALPPGWALVHEQLTLPSASICDGGYFAVLRHGAEA
jgi:16S rRNA (cytosine967-C5)-methyltransferase